MSKIKVTPKTPPSPKGRVKAETKLNIVDTTEGASLFTAEESANSRKSFEQWTAAIVLLFALIAACYAGYHFRYLLPARGTMPGYAVLFFALALAFMWVEVMHWGYKKPFSCVKCMSGWFALILALTFHTHFWYLYPFAGVFVGAMWSAVKMKWL